MDTKQLYRYFKNNYPLFDWLDADMRMAQREGEVKWIYCGVKKI